MRLTGKHVQVTPRVSRFFLSSLYICIYESLIDSNNVKVLQGVISQTLVKNSLNFFMLLETYSPMKIQYMNTIYGIDKTTPNFCDLLCYVMF